MIRQAISCDICGTEKKQTNHWFVAYEQAGELRISPWGSRNRLRPATKHLCGQTCLHKLVDEFMARCVEGRAQPAAMTKANMTTSAIDASLASDAAFDEFESSARLLTPIEATSLVRGFKPQPEPVATPSRPAVESLAYPPSETPRYASRSWHAEAWERERAREMRASANHTEIARRRWPA